MYPNLYFFNPTAEMAIANATHSYQAPQMLRQFELDLGVLPAFFGNENDVLQLEVPLHEGFREQWRRHSIALPQTRTYAQLQQQAQEASLKLNELRPWAWSPAMHHQWRNLKGSSTEKFRQSPVAHWRPEHRDLYSRKMALELLELVAQSGELPHCLPSALMPKLVYELTEIEQAMQRWGAIVVKAPWSSSGRGLQIVRRSPLNESKIQWIKGALQAQSYLLVEPWLDKVADLSFHFRMQKGKAHYFGTTFFETNSNGFYAGHYLGYRPMLPIAAEQALVEAESPAIRLLAQGLERLPIAVHYEGVLGIDALLFVHQQHYYLQPCLEINLRYTMGTLALRLQDLLAEGAKGHFRMYFDKKNSFGSFAQQQFSRQPAEKENARLVKGFMPVCPAADNLFGAYVQLS